MRLDIKDNYKEDLNMLRSCKSCGLEAHTHEELASFVRGKKHKHGYRQLCKKCVNKTQKLDNERVHNNFLRSRYGITLQDYNNMFKEQGGCCAICGKHQTDTAKRLYVDHCHTSGKVRQLLCQQCNSMLGFAKDNTRTLEAAIKYINKHKE